MNAHLEQTALEVISALKLTSEYRELRLAVIGGLARMHYDPGRVTKDVNFVVETSEICIGPKIQKALVEFDRKHGFSFYRRAGRLYHRYKTPDGVAQRHKVNFFASGVCPYLPLAVRPVQDIPEGDIPYISLTDLIVFKVVSCGLRAKASKRRIDAADVKDLLDLYTVATPLPLTKDQRPFVEKGIKEVAKYCLVKPRSWYRERLGLPAEDEDEDEEEDDKWAYKGVDEWAHMWADEEGDEEGDEEDDEEGDEEGDEEEADKEDDEEGNKGENKGEVEQDNTGLYFATSFRLSLFGVDLLNMEGVWVAGAGQ